MGGEHGGLTGQRRIAAGQGRDDVARFDRLQRGLAGQGQRARQGEALQRARAGLVEQLRRRARAVGEHQVRAGRAHVGDALQLREGPQALAIRAAQAHRRFLPVRRVLRPRAARLVLGRVHEHHADRAARDQRTQLLARGAVERAAVVVEARWRAAEHHRDPALEVEAGEIVVIEFRRMHALAHEYRRRFDAVLRHVEIRRRQELVLETQGDLAAVALDPQFRALLRDPPFQQRHGLEVAAVLAGRRQADLAEPLRHVFGGEIEPARAGLAAFHAVVGQLRDILGDAPLCIGLRHRRDLGGRRCRHLQPGFGGGSLFALACDERKEQQCECGTGHRRFLGRRQGPGR